MIWEKQCGSFTGGDAKNLPQFCLSWVPVAALSSGQPLGAASSHQPVILSCRYPVPVSEGLSAALNTPMQSRELSLKLPSVHNKTSSLAEFDQFSDYYWVSMVPPSPPAAPPWKASCLNVKGCSHFPLWFLSNFVRIIQQIHFGQLFFRPPGPHGLSTAAAAADAESIFPTILHLSSALGVVPAVLNIQLIISQHPPR